MPFDGQQVAALALTTIAAGYVVRAVRKALRSARGSSSACGSCGTCDAADRANLPTTRPLVQLDVGRKDAADRRS